MVLRQVQDDLESEGFEVQCFLIPASGIGAWHQRYRVWIVGHSEHNGLLASKIERRNTETATGTQEGTNTTSEPARTSGSRNNEDVSNTNNTRSGAPKYEIEREGQKADKRWKGQPQFESSGHNENVSDTTEIRSSSESIRNTRSMGEESKKKERREGNQSSIRTSSRSSEGREREEDVSNTEIIGTGEPRNIDQEKGNQSSSSTQSNSSSEDVSNTNSGLRGGGRTIQQSRENKVWRFYPEKEEQTRVDIRSETIRRNVVLGEKQNVTHSNSERQQEQCRPESVQEKGNKSERRSWWQIESELCGVPNGISYELDKGRVNRIKTLGNAIVPQIARELGLAIKKVMNEDTDI